MTFEAMKVAIRSCMAAGHCLQRVRRAGGSAAGSGVAATALSSQRTCPASPCSFISRFWTTEASGETAELRPFCCRANNLAGLGSAGGTMVIGMAVRSLAGENMRNTARRAGCDICLPDAFPPAAASFLPQQPLQLVHCCLRLFMCNRDLAAQVGLPGKKSTFRLQNQAAKTCEPAHPIGLAWLTEEHPGEACSTLSAAS